VAAAAAVASGAVGALRRHLARRIHQPQRQLGEQRAAEAVGAAQQNLAGGGRQQGQRPAHPSSAPWCVGGECRAGGGVMDPGEPPADRVGADAGGWGVVAGVTAGAGRIVEQLKGRAGLAKSIEYLSAWISWLQGCSLTILGA